MLRFRYDCVNCKKLKELEYIIDNSKKVTFNTLKKHVDKEDLQDLLTYLGYSKSFPITQDWAVRFSKSKLENGLPVYYIRHSAIEYVFY